MTRAVAVPFIDFQAAYCIVQRQPENWVKQIGNHEAVARRYLD
nr:hypothetical protein [uncultured Kingella sp.]